ncbi:nucleosome assembly protein 1-like 1 [Drosophila guanche]|uniref:Blast:Nucleosome assembly protein 1-like 1 n=1 Tax=Drosophila guanche TaxID=7266 RepID=A0A3B0JYZ5_DROGU|nr:nucleosome assembly protein 1-like 1 [Drosophila guanche]SPP80730.1 blast:Nucleosome assembly protein 1-like 1 [Drosophila guanche]
MEAVLSSRSRSAKAKYVDSFTKMINEKYTEEEKIAIAELKTLYLQTIQLDVELQREIYSLEQKFELKHNVIFDKRKKILQDFKKNHGDSTQNDNVTNFWLRVLKSSYTEFISKKDEQILGYLNDIRTKLYNNPVVKFEVQFHFDKNEFFTNDVLLKTYYLNCVPDIEDPLSYDGAEIYKTEGCVINWKNPQDIENKDSEQTFFAFFNPPILPSDENDPNYCDINNILQNDFELGFYLKERVIPKAVIFFTGEITDCQSSSDSDSDTDDTEESDADEVEDEGSSNCADK